MGLAAASLAAYLAGAAIDRGHGRLVMTLGSTLAALLLLVWPLLSAGWPLYPVFVGIGLAQAMTPYELTLVSLVMWWRG